ncbi:MAG: hypothetical protein HF978_02560 [Desulfobacteraceae bacterium]|nr:hypothetical protein [Desulfobacteraceae bacterium]MBC2754407.1 hypothetical protein [Desulfobacteraceae bacterium]
MLDENIKNIIAQRAKGNELPCAVAFDAADQLGISPAAVGEYADQLKLDLVKCQLGLFGYQPEKRIVKPVDAVTPELEAAIKSELVNDRLPCKSAWQIAKKFNVRKMAVSRACETLEIKIKPCQLGAF